MKIKTADLIGAPLDWAVAKALGDEAAEVSNNPFNFKLQNGWIKARSTHGDAVIDIMEREGISARALRKEGHPMNGLWLAAYDHGNTGSMVQWVKREDWPRHYLSGPTLRIAACRVFVASRLGDEVEVPDELIGDCA